MCFTSRGFHATNFKTRLYFMVQGEQGFSKLLFKYYLNIVLSE